MALEVGQVLKDRYRIDALLGTGGMGAVYRAHDMVLDRTCAVKELVPLPGMSDGQVASIRDQFRREAQVLARLDHPGLPQVTDFFSEGATACLVMDFVEGQSLDHLIQAAGQKGLPENQVLDWGTQVLAALAYCHSQGVIHRDVKPANIIIRSDSTAGPNGRAILVDFGLVKQWDPDQPMTRTSIHGIGTPEYAPPEQYHGGAGHTEPRSDLYALGATLYHALTGQAPATATMRIAVPTSFQRPRSVRADVTPRTEAAILKALELSVDARFPNAAAMATALSGTALLPGFPRPGRARKRSQKRLRWAAGVVAGVLVLASLFAVASFTGWPFEPASVVAGLFSAPTPTPTPSPTPTQTPLPTPTFTPPPTPTPTDTGTPVPTPTLRPSSTPLPALPSETPTVVPTTARPASATPTRKPPTATAKAASPVPTKAPTGQGTIAFAVFNPGIASYTLYTVSPNGSGLHATADYVRQPDASYDGQRILVDGVGGGRNDLWSMRIDGGDWQQVTRHPDDSFATWAPNGGAVVFASTRQGDGNYRLYIGDTLVTTNRSGYVLGSYPVWLPTWEIAFNGCDGGWGTGSHCGIWRLANKSLPNQLTTDPQDIPTDGDASDVLFLHPEGDNWEVYRVGLGGGNPARLTDAPGRDGPATFSPDGTQVAFLSERSGGWALYTMPRQGGSAAKLLDLPNGGNYDAAPFPWSSERITWSAPQAAPTAVPTPPDSYLLPAPSIYFPIWDDTVSSSAPSTVQWSWSGQLAANQGFELRFWWAADNTPLGVAAPTTQTQLSISLGLTQAYLTHGEGVYYLDVVVVQISPYQVLSKTSPVRVKTDPNKK